MSLLSLEGVSKTYLVDPPIVALNGLDFSVDAGERVAILGRSGSGKSTLLNILGLLDEPTAGSYTIDGREVAKTKGAERDWTRAHFFGFVFQESHVLGHRTVAQNVWLGLMASGVPRRVRQNRTEEVLTRVGLVERADALGRLLSGGEKQRLAVARSVVSAPRVVLADEPTGNLDDSNASAVLSLFDAQASAGVAVVVITHDQRTASWADRIMHLDEGRIRTADERAERRS
jgi:ABC-type lipoprotein export system ATPase subunit